MLDRIFSFRLEKKPGLINVTRMRCFLTDNRGYKTLSVSRMQIKDRHVKCRVYVCFCQETRFLSSLLTILDHVGQ